MGKAYTRFQTKTAQKPYPRGAAHTYITYNLYKGVIPPPPLLPGVAPCIKLSKTVMDSGIQAVDFGSQVLDFGLLVSGIWILLVNVIVIPNSLSCQFQILKP